LEADFELRMQPRALMKAPAPISSNRVVQWAGELGGKRARGQND